MKCKRVCHTALFIAALLLLSCGAASAAESVPSSVLRASESVVRINVETTQYTGSGSGFVVVSDRDTTLVATNYHVVEGNPYQISVWIGEEESVSATIRAYSSQ